MVLSNGNIVELCGKNQEYPGYNLLSIVVGSEGLLGIVTIKTGSHIALARETPMNNLFLSMLDRVGAKVESIGDSSGRLNVIDV